MHFCNQGKEFCSCAPQYIRLLSKIHLLCICFLNFRLFELSQTNGQLDNHRVKFSISARINSLARRLAFVRFQMIRLLLIAVSSSFTSSSKPAAPPMTLLRLCVKMKSDKQLEINMNDATPFSSGTSAAAHELAKPLECTQKCKRGS